MTDNALRASWAVAWLVVFGPLAPVAPSSAADRCQAAVDQAKALVDAGKKTEAAQKLPEAIKACTPPASPAARTRLASAHVMLGALVFERSPEEAEPHFRQAMDLDPDNVKARLNLGATLIKRRPAEAIEVLERAIARGPTDADISFKLEYNAGIAFTNLCLRDRSCDAASGERHLRRASELKPEFADTYFQLAAFANDMRHQSREAMDLFKKACDLGHEQGCFQYRHFRAQFDALEGSQKK